MNPTLLIWVSFVTTHALFLGMSFVVEGAGGGPAVLVYPLGLIAFVSGGVATQGGLLAKAGNAQTVLIIRMALAETAAILGFVSWFLSGDHIVQLGCAAIGMMAHLTCFPGLPDNTGRGA